MEPAEGQGAPGGQDQTPEAPPATTLARTDALLLMSMTINVFLAVLVAWWAVSGIGASAGSQAVRNAERDIARLNAVIERLERTVERQAAEADRAATAREAQMQAQEASGTAAEEAVPKTRRVVLPDGRLVITTVK